MEEGSTVNMYLKILYQQQQYYTIYKKYAKYKNLRLPYFSMSLWGIRRRGVIYNEKKQGLYKYKYYST